MKAIEKQYPPYPGNDPYLFLCFSMDSGRKARAFLDRLLVRGVRVWYDTGEVRTRAGREAGDSRMLSASLAVILLDEAFRSDSAAKSRLLACQRANIPIVCLNTDGGDSGLSIGLYAGAEEIRFSRGADAEQLERRLIRSENFSRELIGDPRPAKSAGVRTAVTVMLVLSALLLAAGLFQYFTRRPSAVQDALSKDASPEPADPVSFADETVRESVRSSLGGGLLTEERLLQVTVLRLAGDTLPADLSDLSSLPSLTTVQLSQSAAKEVPGRAELNGYTIELYGGGTP